MIIKLLYNQFKNIYIEERGYVRIQKDIGDENSGYFRAMGNNLEEALDKMIMVCWNILPETTKQYLTKYKEIAELQEQIESNN